MNAQATTNFLTSRNRNRDEIPYVVDFCYGYASNVDKTGWLQDPRPRPFYASHAAISTAQLDQVRTSLENTANSYTIPAIADYEAKLRGKWGRFAGINGVANYWQFFHIPDAIYLSPARTYNPRWPCA